MIATVEQLLLNLFAMMLIGFIVLGCITVSLQYPSPSLVEHKNGENSRIYGGEYATPGQFPWMVHLRIPQADKRSGYCGGFIVSKNFVMTAAHCLKENGWLADTNTITGRVGTIYRNNANVMNGEKGKEVKFSEKYLHPQYTEDLFADIAILKLASSLTFDNTISKICLSKTTPPINQAVIQMGWGRVDNGSVGVSGQLKTTSKGFILDKKKCEEYVNVGRGRICVSNKSTERICEGDSGGPLCVKKSNGIQAVGIVCYDSTDWCVEDNYPSIYTDISSYATWIMDITKGEQLCWLN